MTNAQNDSIGVRVSVKSGGCAGMSYVMEYTKELNPHDEVIEDKGVKVFVDSAAVMYLLGTEMDYKKEELSSSFVFNNPNETERCGYGDCLSSENITTCINIQYRRSQDKCLMPFLDDELVALLSAKIYLLEGAYSHPQCL